MVGPRQSGFTLVELMCAIVIVAVVGSARFFAGGGEAYKLAASLEQTRALRHATTYLERLRGERLVPGRTTIEVESPLRALVLERDVTEIEPGLYEVRVIAHWLLASKPHRIVLTTRMLAEAQ